MSRPPTPLCCAQWFRLLALVSPRLEPDATAPFVFFIFVFIFAVAALTSFYMTVGGAFEYLHEKHVVHKACVHTS